MREMDEEGKAEHPPEKPREGSLRRRFSGVLKRKKERHSGERGKEKARRRRLPPERPPGEISPPPTERARRHTRAPDIDPIEWYLDQLARARVGREDPNIQRQKIGELIRGATTEEERNRYEEFLDTPSVEKEKDLSQRVFTNDLIEARQQLTLWETDSSWSEERRKKARLVREVIAPITEYRESWGDAIERASKKIKSIERGQFDTVVKFFAEAQRSAVAFDDLVVEQRLDGREVTVRQLRIPDGVDVLRLDDVEDVSPEIKTHLRQIKEGYQEDFGTPGQALKDIKVSTLPKEQAEQTVREYFEKAMAFCESIQWFPSGETEARIREFLRQVDPKLDSLYGDSKYFYSFFGKFANSTPGKLVGVEENKAQMGNMISLMKRIPGLPEAMNYTQTEDEVIYCRDRRRFIEDNILAPAFWRQLTPDQQEGIQTELARLDNRRDRLLVELPQLKQRFEDSTGDNELRRKRALLFATAMRRITGLALEASVYRPDQGPADDPFLKLFHYDERMLVPKRFRNAFRLVGTGFANFFGGRSYNFWEAYGKGLVKKNIEEVWQKEGEGENERYHPTSDSRPEDFGLPADYIHNPSLRSGLLPVDWTRINWEKLKTDVEWKFEHEGEKYEGSSIELIQIFDPWFDDLNDADDARKVVDKLLDKETITPEDVQELKGKLKYLYAPQQRRFERFFSSLSDSYSRSIVWQYREKAGESIFSNEAIVGEVRKLIQQGAFERAHFQTYLSFIGDPDGFPKYTSFSELAKNPPTLREGALMVLNLLGGDMRVDGRVTTRGRELVEAFLNTNEETGERVGRDDFINFEEFLFYTGCVEENGRIRFAGRVDSQTLQSLGIEPSSVPGILSILSIRRELSREEFRSRLRSEGLEDGQVVNITRILGEVRDNGSRVVTYNRRGRPVVISNLRSNVEARIEHMLGQRLGHGWGDQCSKLGTWEDIQEHILSKGAKLYLGLNFVPGQELGHTLQRYYQIMESVTPQLGHREVGVGLDENAPITESLISGADPLVRLLHGNWFEWRHYNREDRAAVKRLLPLRLHWDPVLSLQEAWIELGPTMLDGRVQEPWKKHPTPTDWRNVLKQLERPEVFNLLNSDQRELLEIQLNCTGRNEGWQTMGRWFFKIPDRKGEIVGKKQEEAAKGIITAILPGPLKFAANILLPQFPPRWEATSQIGLAVLGGVTGSVFGGPFGTILGIGAGWLAGNDWDERSHWFPAGWGRWLLSRSLLRRNTIPGTGTTIGVWDALYDPEQLAKLFAGKKEKYG